jgi:tape measure domain-containing protein
VAYRADIEIAVRGAQELKRLQDQVSATSKLVDGLNNYLSNIGGGGVVRSINNLNAAVADTAAAFNKAALGTEEATLAARNFVSANSNLTRGLEERLALLKSIGEQERRQRLGAAGIRETTQYAEPIGPGQASPVALRSDLRGRTQQLLNERTATLELADALGQLEERRRQETNALLDAKAASVAQTFLAGKTQYGGPIGPGPASPVGSLVGQKSPVAEKINQTLQARKDEIQLQAALLRLEEKSAAVLNEKLELQQKIMRTAFIQEKQNIEALSTQVAQRQQFLAGKSGTAIQGPLAGPGAMGFPVALSLSKVEQEALQTAAKKQEILQRMVATRQALVGLAANLQRLDLNSSVAIADAVRSQEQLNAAKTRQLQITEQIRASEGAASSAARQRLAQEASRRDRMQNAGFGIQGPALPPAKKGAAAGSSRLGGAISGSIIGGSFPLLFGQGAGAATGGAVGGLVGGLAGPGGSFAGSLLGTLLGDIASKGKGIQDLADDMGLAVEQTKQLAAAFQEAGRDADKFGAAVQTVRGIGFADDEQVEVIKLVSKLTDDYGGKIDKIAAAYGNFAAKGKVGIADINKFTAQGIPILDQLEKKYGKNRDEILALAKAGEITAQDLSDALVEIANRSDEVAKRTTSSFERTFDNLKKGAGTSVSAIAIILGNLVGVSTNVTGNIFEAFSSLYVNLVNGAVEAAARISDALASAANNIAAFYKANPLVIPALRDAAVSGLESFKAGAQGTSKQLRELTKQPTGISQIRGPQIPGQLPPSAGAKGPKPPEDRTAQLREEFIAIVAIGQAEDKVRDLLFEGRELLAAEVELQKQIADIERDRNKALIGANYESERVVITKIAEARIVDAQLKQQDKIREINQKRFEQELQIQEAVRSSVQAFTNMRTEQELQVQYSKTYYRLLAEGVLPAEAERIANFEKTVAAQLKAVDTQLLITNAAIIEAKARGANTVELQKELDLLEQKRKAIEGEARTGPGLAAPEATPAEKITEKIGKLKEEIAALTNIGNIAITVADGIGAAFANAFTGLISGSMTAKEALGSFFKSVADMFLEMAAQIIAKQITMIILQTILKALGAVGGGSGGSGGGTVTGDFMNTEALKGFTPAANGATFANGIAKFANGGIVGSPTLFKFADGGTTRTGLMGEAGPEAIMPLKRGADGSLGVQANGLREAMGRPPGGANGSPVLNMSFQSTSINGVEYVSRDQLESAMAETRRASTRDGAKRGMTMTLDRIQNSSSTRRKVGI